jgi:mono/diheme cytochrome c family protein
MLLKSGVIAVAVLTTTAAMTYAEERNPIEPRVPFNERVAARTLKNPVARTPENIAKGKAVYEGKGSCHTCHGLSGKGDGPNSAFSKPSPRDFTNPKFHRNRTDGEMFWVLKNGIVGTGMVPFIGGPITEEEAWYVILYERSFEGKK